MYLPPYFASRVARLPARVMREHPHPSLITTDDEGLPFVTHLPLHLQPQASPDGEDAAGFTLLGHVARPNPQWRHLQARPRAVVFVTAYSDHAVEAFEVDAVDYLLKPVEEARLDQAITKVLARVKPVAESTANSTPLSRLRRCEAVRAFMSRATAEE